MNSAINKKSSVR